MSATTESRFKDQLLGTPPIEMNSRSTIPYPIVSSGRLHSERVGMDPALETWKAPPPVHTPTRSSLISIVTKLKAFLL